VHVSTVLTWKPESTQGQVPGLLFSQPGVNDLSHWFFYYLGGGREVIHSLFLPLEDLERGRNYPSSVIRSSLLLLAVDNITISFTL